MGCVCSFGWRTFEDESGRGRGDAVIRHAATTTTTQILRAQYTSRDNAKRIRRAWGRSALISGPSHCSNIHIHANACARRKARGIEERRGALSGCRAARCLSWLPISTQPLISRLVSLRRIHTRPCRGYRLPLRRTGRHLLANLTDRSAKRLRIRLAPSRARRSRRLGRSRTAASRNRCPMARATTMAKEANRSVYGLDVLPAENDI